MFESDKEWWNDFVKKMTKYIKKTSEHMENLVGKDIPVYYVRYEDLILEPKYVLP